MAAQRLLSLVALAMLSASGCSRRPGDYSCGLAAMAGLSLALEQFSQPGAAVSLPPTDLPGELPVRMVLGPALHAIVGRADTMLVVGVEGTLPTTPQPGFGVLVVNPDGRAEGVLLYEGRPIEGAPVLGSVNLGTREVPLLGLRLDLARFENPSCPTFVR